MKVFKSILNTIITILIILILIVSILIAVMALTSKASGISSVFGYTVQTIQSDSMKGGYKGAEGYTGGDFEKGDVVIGKATDFDVSRTYQLGDIVTYIGLLQGAEDAGKQLICHRIVDVKNVNGNDVYQTKGDNDEVAKIPDQQDINNYISAAQIASVFHDSSYDGIVIHGVGNFLDFIRTQLGFFLVVLLPMIIFFMYELIRVVLNFAGYKKVKAEESGVSVTGSDEVQLPLGGTEVSSGMTAEEYKEFQEFQAFKKMQEQMKKLETDNSDTEEKSEDDNNENSE